MPIPTLLRTLWYLRPEQWTGQLKRALRSGLRPRRHGEPLPRMRRYAPVVPFLAAPEHVKVDGLNTLTMLHRSVSLRPQIPWDSDAEGPLWLYQLHQCDWMRAKALGRPERLAAALDWIARHPRGKGWDAGPISLRSLVWWKLLATPGALPDGAIEELVPSLADQLVTLAANLETHLLANHYLWNLLALVFGGVVCEGGAADAWLAHGDRLAGELDEQIGGDGAHYEKSPMYHALLLETVLDLANVMQAVPGRAPSALEKKLRDKAARMLGALALMTHPDGEIALLGDAGLEMAPRVETLAAYARGLGIEAIHPEVPGYLRDVGLVRLDAGPFALIATAGPPAPSYQPGHAHGDALSFELSLGTERVVSDTGVYEYVAGERRDHARATRAHATVAIDDADQSEFWAAHRVGGRCDAAWTQVVPGRSAAGVCAGYRSPETLQRRSFTLSADELRIEDRFDLPAPTATLTLPLAPGLEPHLDGRRVALQLASGRRLWIDLPEGARWRVARAEAYPTFGVAVQRKLLVGEARALAAASWRFWLEAENG